MCLPMEGTRHPVGCVARVTPGLMLSLTVGQDRFAASRLYLRGYTLGRGTRPTALQTISVCSDLPSLIATYAKLNAISDWEVSVCHQKSHLLNYP